MLTERMSLVARIENSKNEEYCLNCGQKLIENEEKEEKKKKKLSISKDKIILLDLNYTLIANSWQIRFDKLPQKIYNRKYEHELVELSLRNSKL